MKKGLPKEPRISQQPQPLLQPQLLFSHPPPQPQPPQQKRMMRIITIQIQLLFPQHIFEFLSSRRCIFRPAAGRGGGLGFG
jgi:hypothetical protein